ncbi:MAG: hypothetical protein K1X31_13510 [Gemmatimonadaceae bacterium]|nr:hypothetical protein [Gemmatimonadaceae bacterium]
MRRLIPTLCGAALLAAIGCDPAPAPPARTPEQQRAVDSTVGASALPGAGGVRGALAAQDSAKAKQAQLDSLAKAP